MNKLREELLNNVELQLNYINSELKHFIFEFKNNKKRIFSNNKLCMIQSKLLELEEIIFKK